MNTAPAKRKVGVIGGMGPEATVYFMSRIIALTPASDDSDHVPLIVDNNTQVPSRIKALIDGTGKDPGPVLAQMAKGLEASGARALAMPCNTAHHYAPVLLQAVDIPFIDMTVETASVLTGNGLGNAKVGLLASPAVQQLSIFEKAFAQTGIKVVWPTIQSRVLEAIKLVKAGNRIEQARQIVKTTSRELGDRGAQAIIVACSELSIIADSVPPTLPVFDTVDILARAVISFASRPLD